MHARTIKILILTLFLSLTFLALNLNSRAQKSITPPAIPQTWDEAALKSLELPLADPKASPVQVSADYYYRIPERTIYQSYPVYAPGKAPAGYEAWLKEQEPKAAFDVATLKTKEDWLRAGELVFEAPIFYNAVVNVDNLKDPRWYEKINPPIARDGSLPFFRYVVREKGKIELGTISCAMCHTRVLTDGTVVKGAQGNFPFELAATYLIQQRFTVERARGLERSFFATPWIKPDLLAGLDQMSLEQLIGWHAAIPAGVLARQGSSPLSPTQIPDLIGVKERKYLDHTGVQQQRSIADLMRYAAINQGANDLASFAGFIPAAKDQRTLPDATTQLRYSDAQLYALALYLYSLTPPTNPHPFDKEAARGQKIFEQEGCAVCHTPPFYTNNRLTPVEGFAVPAEHFKEFDILPRPVGTDPTLALKTRRGTGYYKVPSLRGVWYRGPFEHNGSVATLEDWFDPARLSDAYVPTGFKGYGVKTRAVKGHEFGLKLSPEDKQALIAFLKTL